MDFQPNNVHVRKAEERVLQVTGFPFECYHYVNATLFTLPTSGTALTLKPRRFVTTWRYYDGLEAQQALALPGLAPTHVIKLRIPAAITIQGPAWIDPLPASLVGPNPNIERYGNGLEFIILDPLTLYPPNYEIIDLS